MKTNQNRERRYRAQADLEADSAQRKSNNTGLSDRLKSGIENLSGMDLSLVRVHRNSAEPAKVGAHAFAQGTNIHLAPGQEKHLPHEAWHVVQQAQGRVRPTTSVNGRSVNDDKNLEGEADVMGSKALQLKAHEASCKCASCNPNQLMKYRFHPLQLNGPERPVVDTSTLKGKVIDRALNHIPDQAKHVKEVDRWMYECYHCKKWITEEAVNADHYPIPQARGGSDDIGNLVLSCGPCNQANIHNSRQMITRGQIKDAGDGRKYVK